MCLQVLSWGSRCSFLLPVSIFVDLAQQARRAAELRLAHFALGMSRPQGSALVTGLNNFGRPTVRAFS